MQVAVIGCGYVGLVTSACLASMGHFVRGIECNSRKLAMLRGGRCPVFEPGLDELLASEIAAGRLEFSADLPEAVRTAEVVFLCVGTPPREDGTVDTTALRRAAGSLAEALKIRRPGQSTVVVTKSTVPPGTNRDLQAYFDEQAGSGVAVVSNPEFLREGTAVVDCLEPDRIVAGGQCPAALAAVRRLYEPILGNSVRYLQMGWESAEITKYAANAMLAARISFMNEMSVICEGYGADIEEVRQGIGADGRIGPAFLRAGCGYGGSCFPKDVAALEHISRAVGHESLFVDAIQRTNENQKARFVDKIERHLGRPIAGSTIAVWGLAFKAGTDDIRESAAIAVIRQLLDRGACVRVTDPRAVDNMKEIFGHEVEWMAGPAQAAAGADAVALLTDWNEYRHLPFSAIALTMNQPLLFDGRNCLDPEAMRRSGFNYHPVGRPPAAAKRQQVHVA